MEDNIIASWGNQKNQSKKSLSERNYDNFNCLPSESLSYPRQSLQVGEPAQYAKRYRLYLEIRGSNPDTLEKVVDRRILG